MQFLHQLETVRNTAYETERTALFITVHRRRRGTEVPPNTTTTWAVGHLSDLSGESGLLDPTAGEPAHLADESGSALRPTYGAAVMNKRDIQTLRHAAEIIQAMNRYASPWLASLAGGLNDLAASADTLERVMAKPKETGHDG